MRACGPFEEMDSFEYKTLKKYFPDLVRCIAQSPKDIADKLRPTDILSQGDVSFLQNPSHDRDDKARRIVEAVLIQVENNTQKYYELVKAMRASGDWTKETVSKLEEAQKTVLAFKHCSPEEAVLVKS